MKARIFILMTTLCFCTIGCSSIGGLIAFDQADSNGKGFEVRHQLPSQFTQDDSTSFEVFNLSPYVLHLEFDEIASNSNQTPVRGDGGASLNAYAACLTLKVMF
jgi:hypothetical protein